MKALILLLLCSAASAQTFDYTGAAMTGTETHIVNNAMVTDAITGFISAEIVVQNNMLMSYSADFHGSNGADVPLGNVGGAFVDTGIAGPSYSGPTGDNINLTFLNGKVSGANFAFWDQPYHSDYIGLGIGPTDNFSYTWAPHGTCADNVFQGVYQSTPVMCTAFLTSTVAGTWVDPPTPAPEIDPKSGIAPFLLLAFGLAVIRGRER